MRKISEEVNLKKLEPSKSSFSFHPSREKKRKKGENSAKKSIEKKASKMVVFSESFS